MITRRLIACTVACAATAGLLAAQAVAGPIEERQATMKDVGKALTALAAIAKKEQPFSAEVVKTQADIVAAKFTAAKAMFPEGTEKGPPETWAKPEVWAKHAEFVADMDKAIAAATALAAVKEEAQFMPALKAVGGSCNTCHEAFRRPKE